VLWGERDRHFPTAHATRLQSAIPKATLTIVRGAEHWMAWYLAEPVGRAIVEFADAHA
jgi:pimeloyl-ACP methyl ester carboxylesterase